MATAAEARDPRAKIVAEKLRSLIPTDLPFWSELDALSTHTTVESLDIDEDAIVFDDSGAFSATFNVYVSLQYGKDNNEGFTIGDSFLAESRGHFEDGDPVIDSADIDTSSFYEQ